MVSHFLNALTFSRLEEVSGCLTLWSYHSGLSLEQAQDQMSEPVLGGDNSKDWVPIPLI